MIGQWFDNESRYRSKLPKLVQTYFVRTTEHIVLSPLHRIASCVVDRRYAFREAVLRAKPGSRDVALQGSVTFSSVIG